MANRESLAERLIGLGYLRSEPVIKAFREVDRQDFLPKGIEDLAYHDSPLPIGGEQTISAPHMVAIMTEEALLEEGHQVLEIGAGSGYHACIVSTVTRSKVYSIERLKDLAEEARKNLKKSGCYGVEVIVGDGTMGYPEKAPYDRIIVTAAAPKVPEPLVNQLKVGGKLLIPVGSRMTQELQRYTKTPDGMVKEGLGGCVFVPLIGRHGWSE